MQNVFWERTAMGQAAHTQVTNPTHCPQAMHDANTKTEDKSAQEVDKMRVLTCFLRCRCDAGLALAVQRYAREHGISVALTMRMALISWCDRTGYLRAAQKAVQRNSDAAMKELRRLYRT